MKKNIRVNPTYRRNKIWSKLTAFPQITLLHFGVALNLSFFRKSASLEEAGSFSLTESDLTWLTKADMTCHSNEWLIRLGNSKKTTIFQDNFWPLHSSPTYCAQDFQKQPWEQGAIKPKEGKVWGKRMVFPQLWQYFVQETTQKSQPFCVFSQKFLL